jgi:hypothetical protein
VRELPQFDQSCAEIKIGECAHCGELERKLANTTEELSSVKIILKRMQMEQTHDDGYSVNIMDESNEWTTVIKNRQRMTSRNNSNNDSLRAIITPTKNSFYPLYPL